MLQWVSARQRSHPKYMHAIQGYTMCTEIGDSKDETDEVCRNVGVLVHDRCSLMYTLMMQLLKVGGGDSCDHCHVLDNWRRHMLVLLLV